MDEERPKAYVVEESPGCLVCLCVVGSVAWKQYVVSVSSIRHPLLPSLPPSLALPNTTQVSTPRRL